MSIESILDRYVESSRATQAHDLLGQCRLPHAFAKRHGNAGQALG